MLISGSQSASGRGQRIATVGRMEQMDGKRIIQGARDGGEGGRTGPGQSLAIAEDSGRMALTASENQ